MKEVNLTAKSLLEFLKTIPEDAIIHTMYDGYACPNTFRWLTKDGRVILAPTGVPIYEDEDKPFDPPIPEDSSSSTPDHYSWEDDKLEVIHWTPYL